MDTVKSRLYKRIGVSASIIGIILIAILIPQILLYTRRCTTNFFHFNIDYRLGNETVEDTIIREPYYKMLKMYEKHPSWKFTIECQAAMIERIFENDEYKEIQELTEKLIKRGQMELICGIQYSQLFYAYPSDVFELNLKYANETLDKYDLLDKRSNCLLFQEGQFGYGLTVLLNSKYASNIDTVLISSQQLKDFQPSDYREPDYPVYKLKNDDTGDYIYLLQYDYLPKWEAGYIHSWNFLFDAELAFEDKNAEKEFSVDDNKIKAYEKELELLEQEGNIFFTCSEWVKHCKDYGAIKELDYYIIESNWGTTKYNSSYIWMANNGDSTDDGELLANNYRCRNIIKSTKIIYEAYKSFLNSSEKALIESKFKMAEKLMLQAMVTDATGIGPDPIERVTAEGNVLTAENNCSQIIKIIADKVKALNVSRIQVDLKTRAIINSTSNFTKLITTISTSIDINNLPIDIDFGSLLSNGNTIEPQVSVSKVKYNSSDDNNDILEMYKLDVIFQGTHDWADDSILSISIKFDLSEISHNLGEIVYSPSLLENTTKRLWRYQYRYDPIYLFLPLSNGLIFFPDEYTGFRGLAIVKNVTSRHTSWLWSYSYIKVLETEGLHLDAHHQFYILNNVSLEKAVRFANRINVNPVWVVSKNVSLIQGNEVYEIYKNMKNKFAEDVGSGEWW